MNRKNAPQMASSPETRATYGHGRAVRLEAELYACDIPIHLTICAATGKPFETAQLAELVCQAAERTAANLLYRLYAYCLMPDHMHLLLSPHESETAVEEFLRKFKSFTTRQHQKMTGEPRLWQYSARDRLMRPSEDIRVLAAYIANNPVRKELVKIWTDWPYTKIFIDS